MKRNKAKRKLGKALETAKAKGVAIGKKIGETKGYKAAADAAKAAASKVSNSSLGSKVLGGLGSAAEAGRSIGGSGLLGKGLKVAGAAGAAAGRHGEAAGKQSGEDGHDGPLGHGPFHACQVRTSGASGTAPAGGPR
jgi:hypothetical protein